MSSSKSKLLFWFGDTCVWKRSLNHCEYRGTFLLHFSTESYRLSQKFAANNARPLVKYVSCNIRSCLDNRVNWVEITQNKHTSSSTALSARAGHVRGSVTSLLQSTSRLNAQQIAGSLSLTFSMLSRTRLSVSRKRSKQVAIACMSIRALHVEINAKIRRGAKYWLTSKRSGFRKQFSLCRTKWSV